MSRFAEIQHSLLPREGELGVSWTGQAGFSFKTSHGHVFHIDPYLSNVSSRYVGYHRAIAAPVEAGQLRGKHFFFTHDHRDHLDTDSVPVIAEHNPEAVFYGPPSCISRLLELKIAPERLVTIKRGETLPVENVHVKAVLAVHTNDSVGYVFSFGYTKVYITGDTLYSDELAAIAADRPNLMMACINGRLGCMNIADAVRLTSHIQPLIAIPMHVNMFVENTANSDEYVRQAELHSGVTKGFVMEHGEWYVYSRTNGLHKAVSD